MLVEYNRAGRGLSVHHVSNCNKAGQWRSDGGQGAYVPGRRARGAFLRAKTYFACQLVQDENMGHLQF